MPHQNELIKRTVVVEYRDPQATPKTTTVDCWKVEGWTSDYAFFDEDGRVFMLIPREIVRVVGRVGNVIAEQPVLSAV